MGTWDKIHSWNLVLPPSRPSGYHLSLIRKEISHFDLTKPVAVLGSTPEFRDLLHEVGFTTIYILDNNPGFYRSMSSLRVYSNKEVFEQGDWLDLLPKFENFFSLILSDLTMGNISYDNRSLFYELIHRAINKGGYFVDKVLTHPGDNLELMDLINKYSLLPVNLLNINYFSCEFIFCSKLLDINQMVDSSLFYNILRENFEAQPFNQRLLLFLRHAHDITPLNCIWYYGKKWIELKDNYCPNLDLVKCFEDEIGSPYFNRLKLFIFKKERY